jgi:hypothetical protein
VRERSERERERVTLYVLWACFEKETTSTRLRGCFLFRKKGEEGGSNLGNEYGRATKQEETRGMAKSQKRTFLLLFHLIYNTC